MALFRLRWFLSRIVDTRFRNALEEVLASPASFYVAAARHMTGLTKNYPELRLKNGGRVSVPSFMTLYIFDEIFIQGVYDRNLSVVPRTILDIGANTGLFTLRAKQLWPDAKIVAFEPDLENFVGLRRTIETNQLTEVTAINAAVTKDGGPIKLHIHPRNNGGHSTVHSHSSRHIIVPSVTITDALSELGDACDLLKIDCEGAEESILRGITPGDATKIGAIVYEPDWGFYSVPSLNHWISSLGFTVTTHKDVVVALK